VRDFGFYRQNPPSLKSKLAGIMDGILKAVRTPLKILLLDKQSTKIISAALDMTHLTACGVSRTSQTFVPALNKINYPPLSC